MSPRETLTLLHEDGLRSLQSDTISGKEQLKVSGVGSHSESSADLAGLKRQVHT
jgi:hypothetical protein